VTPGTLTVGVVSNGPLLTFDGGTAGGPEAAFLRFAASKLGLAVSYTSVSDEAAALRSGQVDVVAGQLAITPERTRQYWMTSIPIAFSPDYIYVKPGSDGSFPSYGSWEDVAKAGQTLAVVQGDPRAADIQKAGAQVQAFPTAADALRAVAGGFVGGYVGTTLDYVVSASADGAISNAGIGWVRNTNSYTHGVAYGWGIKPGNDKLVDALDQALTMAWQQHVVSDTYGSTWPGADASAVEAPGPSLVGTGYGSSKDYVWRGIWPSGAWLQRPGYVTQ
jgi:ABC-type amino acid transport substrate-binding protein